MTETVISNAANDSRLSEPPEEGLYTIDELSAASGVPSRTIRFYQSEGALQPPERRGRKAYYAGAHIDRLKLIGDLQDQGLQIRAIKNLLDNVGNSSEGILEQWLGIGEELKRPWIADSPTLLTLDELRQRLDGSRSGLLGVLLDVGVARQEGDRYLVPSPAMLEMVIKLERAGIDTYTAKRAADMLTVHLQTAADELSRFFVSEVRSRVPGEPDTERVMRIIDTLQPLALQAVQVIFAHGIENSLTRLLADGEVGAGPSRRDRMSRRDRDKRRR